MIATVRADAVAINDRRLTGILRVLQMSGSEYAATAVVDDYLTSSSGFFFHYDFRVGVALI